MIRRPRRATSPGLRTLAYRPRPAAGPRPVVARVGAQSAASPRAAGTPVITTPFGPVSVARLPRAALFGVGSTTLGILLIIAGLFGLAQAGARSVLTSEPVSTLGPAVAGAVNPVLGVAATALTAGAKGGKSGRRKAGRALAGLVKKRAKAQAKAKKSGGG